METFEPWALPVLIGSMPLTDHVEAADLVATCTPQIPGWVQLPAFANEAMVAQFLPGMPAVVFAEDRTFVDLGDDSGSDQLLAFYEEYMAVESGQAQLAKSRFALGPEAGGYHELLRRCSAAADFQAVKGQVTGPITFATAVTDRQGRAVFYDDQLRDAAIKLLAMKARFQVRQLARFGKPVLVFIDEPALAGFGTSEMISISADQIIEALSEVVLAVHAEGGLAAVHVCANTDWSMILKAPIDFVNFDAYGFFDRFILFSRDIRQFMENGGGIAWGIVPTSDAQAIETATVASLAAMMADQLGQLSAIGLDRGQVLSRSLITPSCGVGSLSRELAVRVLELTRDLSRHIRSESGK